MHSFRGGNGGEKRTTKYLYLLIWIVRKILRVNRFLNEQRSKEIEKENYGENSRVLEVLNGK